MPVLLAMAGVLFLFAAPWPVPTVPHDRGVAIAAADAFAAHHEAAARRVAGNPNLVGVFPVPAPGRELWRQQSCHRGGAVATTMTAAADSGGAMLSHLRHQLGDPPGLGIADGSSTVLGSDQRRHALPCTVRAGALVLVSRI